MRSSSKVHEHHVDRASHVPGPAEFGAATAKDPVCGMSVDPATAAATREYNGTTYYFCNPGCAAKFEQNPTQYLA